MIFSNQKYKKLQIVNSKRFISFFHCQVCAVMRLAGNSDAEVVGADTDMRGVDVSANGGNNGIVNSLQERSVDSGVVDDGLGGESLQAGEHIAQDGSLVDQGSLDSRVVDEGLVDSSSEGQRVGGVDQGRVGLRLSFSLSLAVSVVSQGSLNSRVVDDGLVDTSGDSGSLVDGVDQRSVVHQGSFDTSLDYVVDEGLVDSSSEGQSVAGVDQGRSGHLLSLLRHRDGLVD